MILARFLVCLLLICSWATSHAEYFVIRDYRINIQFTEDGYADFTEEIIVEFSEQRRGIYRFIPFRDNIDGKRVDREFEKVRVEKFKFKESTEGTNYVIRIGDPNVYVNGLQSYIIHYRIVNPLNFFKDHTEFYWDVLGTNWPVPIEQVQIDVHFPKHVTLTQDDVRIFTGAAGTASTDIQYRVSSNAIYGTSSRVFQPGEGATVAVLLDKNDFKALSGWKLFLKRHGLLFAPLLFLIGGLIAFFKTRNRSQAIAAEFFPPDGISPAVAGGFVDHSVDPNDVLSLIPHLANKGYLKMEVEEGGFLQKDKVTFIKLKDSGPDLMPFEDHFFTALFSYGDRVTLDMLKNKFYIHLSAVQSAVKGWIQNQGWYEPDNKRFAGFTGVAGLISVAWGVFAAFFKQNPDGFALILTGVILFIIATRFNKRSTSGEDTFRKLAGFREFVSKAEKPVIEKLLKEDPLYYDKTMPYALAFGYLKQWNNKFSGLLSQPPQWYGGPHVYVGNMHQSWENFSTSFPSEINTIGSVFSSAPSSSGGGGFSGGGGGFSGGGSGGGGGGSW